MGCARSEPKSEGRKRFTPAATAASMRMFWLGRPSVPTAETTASWPWKAAVTDCTEVVSARATLTEAGKVALDVGRLMTVTVNFPESMRAFKMGAPMAPEACGGG